MAKVKVNITFERTPSSSITYENDKLDSIDYTSTINSNNETPQFVVSESDGKVSLSDADGLFAEKIKNDDIGGNINVVGVLNESRNIFDGNANDLNYPYNSKKFSFALNDITSRLSSIPASTFNFSKRESNSMTGLQLYFELVDKVQELTGIGFESLDGYVYDYLGYFTFKDPIIECSNVKEMLEVFCNATMTSIYFNASVGKLKLLGYEFASEEAISPIVIPLSKREQDIELQMMSKNALGKVSIAYTNVVNDNDYSNWNDISNTYSCNLYESSSSNEDSIVLPSWVKTAQAFDYSSGNVYTTNDLPFNIVGYIEKTETGTDIRQTFRFFIVEPKETLTYTTKVKLLVEDKVTTRTSIPTHGTSVEDENQDNSYTTYYTNTYYDTLSSFTSISSDDWEPDYAKFYINYEDTSNQFRVRFAIPIYEYERYSKTEATSYTKYEFYKKHDYRILGNKLQSYTCVVGATSTFKDDFVLNSNSLINTLNTFTYDNKSVNLPTFLASYIKLAYDNGKKTISFTTHLYDFESEDGEFTIDASKGETLDIGTIIKLEGIADEFKITKLNYSYDGQFSIVVNAMQYRNDEASIMSEIVNGSVEATYLLDSSGTSLLEKGGSPIASSDSSSTTPYKLSMTGSQIDSALSLATTAIQKVKTINSQSIIGEGNIVIEGGGSEPSAYLKSASVSGNTLTLTNKDSTTISFTPTTSIDEYVKNVELFKPSTSTLDRIKFTKNDGTTISYIPPENTSDLINDSDFITSSSLSSKQDTLVSGTNIKTINGNSLLGSGNIVIEGGGGTPSNYLQSATVSDDGKTLSIINNTSSTPITFSPASDVYTKSEIDTKFTNYDTSSEVDEKIGKLYSNDEIDSMLSQKVGKDVNDLTNYYTSSSVDSLIETRQQKITATNKLSASLVSGLASVATSGSYTDLSNKPTIPDVSNFITKDVSNLTNYTKTSDLADVATSGSYEDLSNKPTIPTSYLSNATVSTDGVTLSITKSDSQQAITFSSPTQTSALENDSGYVTKDTNALENYITSDDMPSYYYGKSDVDALLLQKQDSLSTTQLSAVNSGITSTKVQTYDSYELGKQNIITSTNKLSASLVSGLADVATTGSYNDLTDKPTTPTTFLSDASISDDGYSLTIDKSSGDSITFTKPSALSELDNDVEYVTVNVDSLVNYYTKDEMASYYYDIDTIDGKLGNKQDNLTSTQISAVDSGITSTLVTKYNGYESTISGKQAQLSTTQLAATNSGITSTKVSTYDGYSTSKQDTLVSATNIKTINGESILGSGNLVVSGGGSLLYKHTLNVTFSGASFNDDGTDNQLSGTIELYNDRSTAYARDFSDFTSGVYTINSYTIIGDILTITFVFNDAYASNTDDLQYLVLFSSDEEGIIVHQNEFIPIGTTTNRFVIVSDIVEEM